MPVIVCGLVALFLLDLLAGEMLDLDLEELDAGKSLGNLLVDSSTVG